MKAARLAVTLSVLAIVLSSAVVTIGGADGVSEDRFLLDSGNGVSEWTDLDIGPYSEVITSAAGLLGHDVVFGTSISVDGIDSVHTGTVTSTWHVFGWNGVAWEDRTDGFDPSEPYTGGAIALGFYPDGVLPVETPDHRSSWTMVRGDSQSTGTQTADLSTGVGSVAWDHTYGTANYVGPAVLVEGKHAYVVAGGGYTTTMNTPTLHCYDRFTGDEVWKFEYPRGAGYEVSTGAIVGDMIYLPATNGTVYGIPLDGPGGGEEVISLSVSNTIDHDLSGVRKYTGATSIVYDSGVLYFGTGNGYVVCTDLSLNVIWKTPIGGSCYYSAPAIVDGTVFVGSYDGRLYALDRGTGSILDSTDVYRSGSTIGNINTPAYIDGVLMVSYADGQGMNAMTGGIAGYRFDGSFTRLFDNRDVGLCSGYLVPFDDGFEGVYLTNMSGFCRLSVDGDLQVLREFDAQFKAPLTLVNGSVFYIPEYTRGGNIYAIDADGSIIGSIPQTEKVAEFCMSPTVVVDGMIYNGTDGGVMAFSGAFPPIASEGGSITPYVAIAIVLAVIAVFVIYCIHIKKDKGVPPIAFIRTKLRESSGFNNERTSKVRKNKRRLASVLLIGVAIGAVLFLMSLAYGPTYNYSLGEALSLLVSAIGKSFSGEALTNDEVIVFTTRCSRAVAAFAVGIGLSISGSIYQAIIRNPMVDPYIMGVSAGAGVAAVATIAFNFTFFGLLGDTTLATPIVAMVGGVVAFGATMLLAERAGGSSINYVLAGIIIGLVFSAIQTLMLSMAGDKLNSAMSWLFGSFANISWTQAVLVAIPAVALSLVPLVWAKEFNLVLLGEDQARQMGLDVHRFNRWMLILASVLASVCVAFVGIVGFVGLVVPHLCRMILGGDHRLVMPASMVVGGALMLAADLFSKLVMAPMELPVGAITTVIGAPVFAYLLIKKGRMYDG